MSEHVFRRNLLALSKSAPGIVDLLSKVEPDSSIVAVESRAGPLVPVAQVEGRVHAFHSLVDPEREASRIAENQNVQGFVIAFGLGGGFLLKSLLKSTATTGILVVEYSAPKLRSILEDIDLSDLFSDDRFMLVLDPSPSQFKEIFLSVYVPPVAGDIRTIPLHSRIALDPEPFTEISNALKSILSDISNDYSVQAFFGKLWFRNVVRNLFSAERAIPPLPSIRKAVVTAAGPSFETSLPTIKKARQDGFFIIATDTSMPAMLGGGIEPDVVVSIDCQHISYYHFISGMPRSLPLVLDLASPPALPRLCDCPRFFSSGHPLCSYVSSHWRSFPALDTSGGNVTHAALSLAEALGAEECVLAGADFSYPKGKSYARGTYIYDYFQARQSRLSSLETLFSSFVFRSPDTIRESFIDAQGIKSLRYLTKPLIAYREHLERFASSSPMRIIPLQGTGVDIRIIRPNETVSASTSRKRERRIFAAGAAPCTASEFLIRYRNALMSLERPYSPTIRYLNSLNHTSRDLWTTLLPAASAFQRETRGTVDDPADILEMTRDWAVEIIGAALNE
jgi:hypothetical protein